MHQMVQKRDLWISPVVYISAAQLEALTRTRGNDWAEGRAKVRTILGKDVWVPSSGTWVCQFYVYGANAGWELRDFWVFP